ncbi:MAG: hypothetical protein PHS41_01260 [Victivallaceae bacterium]|nr:hypothetical protein [Victivallaceae bacterium]
MKTSILFAAAFSGILFAAGAGTVVYRVNGSEKSISDAKLISIDNKIVTFKYNGGTQQISVGNLVKYYDSDSGISGGAFDDGTLDYNVSIRDVTMPERGMTSSHKNRVVAEAKIRYVVDPKLEKNRKMVIREPYFYLFVLSESKDGSRRAHHVFSYPAAAKYRTKYYNEPDILKQINSPDRAHISGGNFNTLGGLSGEKSFKIALKGIGERKIVAYTVIAWGKDREAGRKNWTRSGLSVSENWFMRIR